MKGIEVTNSLDELNKALLEAQSNFGFIRKDSERRNIIFTGSKEKDFSRYNKDFDLPLSNINLIVTSNHVPAFNIIGGRNGSLNFIGSPYFYGISDTAFNDTKERVNIYISGSSDIEIYPNMNGYQNISPYISEITAISCIYSKNIKIDGGYICNYKNAIDFKKCSDVEVYNGIQIFNIRTDGIAAFQVDGITINRCYIHSFLPNYGSMTLHELLDNNHIVPSQHNIYSDTDETYDHSDFIQLSNCENIQLLNNRLGGHLGENFRLSPDQGLGDIFPHWNKRSYIWNQTVLIKPEVSSIGSYSYEGAYNHIDGLETAGIIDSSEAQLRKDSIIELVNSVGSSLRANVAGGSFSSSVSIINNRIYNHHKHGITVCGYDSSSVDIESVQSNNILEYNSYQYYPAHVVEEIRPRINIKHSYSIDNSDQVGC